MTATIPPRIQLDPAPVLPLEVYVEHVGDVYVLHAPSGCGRGPTRVPTSAFRHACALPRWCDRQSCWPGRRCGICREPSGGRDECHDCNEQTLRIDKAFARAS